LLSEENRVSWMSPPTVGQLAPAPSVSSAPLGLADFFSAAVLKLAGLASVLGVVSALVGGEVVVVVDELLDPPPPQAANASAAATTHETTNPILNSTLL
jgi:hypothetical protein